jgi:iron complex transport system permease protein
MRLGTRIGLATAVLAGLAAAAVAVALAVGTAPIGLMDVVRAFVTPDRVSPETLTIVRSLRLPRVLMALAAGGALSVSGVVFQAILKNPLADPFILGVSSGAALGTVIGSLVFRVPSVLGGALPAFAGALITILIVFYVARIKERLYPNTMLLVGVIINAFFSAAIMAIVSLFRSNGLQGIFFWLMGDLSLVSITEVAVVSAVFLSGSVLVFYYARPMNLLQFGEESAASGGVDVERTKRVLFVAASVMTAAVVSAAGVIGFVGLIIPHMIRMVLGPDHRILIPTSVLLGGTFLLVSDTVARTVVSPLELPVGVLTALLGAPFFVYLLRRQL